MKRSSRHAPRGALGLSFVLWLILPTACGGGEDSGGGDGDGDSDGDGDGDGDDDGASVGGSTSENSGGNPGSGSGPGSGGSWALPGTGGAPSQGSRAACKRGIAYGHHSKADFAQISSKVAWWYNWAARPDSDLRDGSYLDADVDYVPMVWGGNYDAAEIIERIPAGAEALLGFNEPNFGDQANLSAAEAAALWPGVEAIADDLGLLLVSPAVNFCGGNCKGTNPFNYLDAFFAACTGCRVDAIAIHIYVGCEGTPRPAQWLINHVETYKSRFSQPLWLTEFACDSADSSAEQIAFLEDALAYLEAEPRIARYAWFTGRWSDPNSLRYVDLFGADGQLTSVGQAYVNAPVDDACPD